MAGAGGGGHHPHPFQQLRDHAARLRLDQLEALPAEAWCLMRAPISCLCVQVPGT
jgi:hypothetical protein